MTDTQLPPPAIVLNVGKSGAGKTGAVLALAKRGFRVRVADFDKAAAQVFYGIMHDAQGRLKPEYAKVPPLLDVVSFADKLKPVGGKIKLAGFESAWERFLKAQDNWTAADGSRPGGLFSWGRDTVFVIDTLTAMSNAAMRYIMKLNGREGENPSQPNWGDAMRGVEDVLSLLRFGPTECHVVVNAHIQFLEGEDGKIEGLPLTLGNKLAPKIPALFPVMVRTANVSGPGGGRKILTSGDSRMELKVPVSELDPALSQADGLATIFARLGWGAPPPPQAQPEEKAA
jgi:hypothetical protein